MRKLRAGWNFLRIQQKVWVILLVVCVPLIAAFALHLTLINHLRTLQQHYHQVVLAREQVHILRRLVVDTEDAFRGYLLTRQEVFLKPMREAEPRMKPTVSEILRLAAGVPDLEQHTQHIDERLNTLLTSKHTLLQQVEAGHFKWVLQYVRSGQGIALSDDLRERFRMLEDLLIQQAQNIETHRVSIVHIAFWGLMVAVPAVIGLGFTAARLLARSITGPVSALQRSVTALGSISASDAVLKSLTVSSSDEIGDLARSYREMVSRIEVQIRELEAISAIGHEINTIRPDGLDGVLWRITNHAADLLHADICLVMLRNDRMGCWVVEAASGDWNDRLYKSVMLWEEFPVSVKAFDTKQPAIGENLRRDARPEVMRRNLIGESMLSIPLLSQGTAFGVLVLLRERSVPRDAWNIRLAKGFAAEAAIAIANARLYETAQIKGKEVQARIRELQHLAEMLAHDLKAPGERVEALATLLQEDSGGQLSEQAIHRLRLIEENGRDLSRRVEHILEVARVGSQATAVEAIDPGGIIQDILKQRAGELEQGRVRVDVQNGMPLVACHRAYLRQVFDNLISNAIKFSCERTDAQIRISYAQKGERVSFTVSDNGRGIPPEQRQHVFAPFVRLNPHCAPGSGIGLTIVKRIVDLYGGKVWVESSTFAGCSVIFTMPALGGLRQEIDTRQPDSADPPRWAYGISETSQTLPRS